MKPPSQTISEALCPREDGPGRQASGTSFLKRPRLPSGTEQFRGWTPAPHMNETLTVEATALDPSLLLALSPP